jgi:hypothetical protein
MIEPMHLDRIGKAILRLVEDQCVVFPGVPVSKYDLHELVRPVVAGVMMALIEVGKRQAIIKKRHLDLAVFQGTGDALVVFRGQEIRHRRWMAPRSRQVRAVLRLQKGDQRHHAVLDRHRRSL